MFYRAKFQPGDKFIYGIYGIQYQGQSPNTQQLDLIEKFDKLITGQAHLDHITVPGTDGLSTQIWLSYWWPEAHAKWWSSPAVKQFWDELPEDAGMWREILTATANRVQNACTAELRNGMNGVGEMEPFGDKIGYWGCVRHRIPDSKDKDHSGMSAEEKTLWFEEFDELVSGWMGYLAKDTTANGLFDVRMGHVPDFGTFKTGTPVNLNHNRKIELFYWQDMSKFERVGRIHRGHVKLRKRWMEVYGAGGEMGDGKGQINLWEETSILKGSDILAEYVGCREGTGFMAFDKSGIIHSQQVD
ncbi:unnamed protein product [Fusarium fujikuroi]|uniref:Aldoxime dehydratase n=1 Tax=Fusarium fujikuroi TaxID=5127 RepID=A0A9Q9RWE1_FUSFU|nr:uncharacterized protein FFE2_15485 [Fusarium fujikuroi]SCO37045.1 uncharacterized protein FFNC_05417 [Fusarium fujikuroi]SCV60360.1 uncharacterized protein FFFS_14929 [Fusarium fujikuroi]VTT79045.1 unnamed protein product [Fusarium fujikuroi]VTT81683.1 unnamed protein product [Fusarium fujikuroi]